MIKLKAIKDLKLDGFGGLLEERERRNLECPGNCVECEGKSGYVEDNGMTNPAHCTWCTSTNSWWK